MTAKSKVKKLTATEFVVCLRNNGCEVSLERLKIYGAIPDPHASRHRQVRVIDESGEDYLFPRSFFAAIDVPRRVRQAMRRA